MRFLTQERSTKEKLAKKFGVAGIPCLVILDAETAAVCTKNGERKRLVENGWFKPRIVLMLVLSLSWQTNRNYETQKTNRCVFFLSQVVKAFQRVTKRHFLSTVYIKMIIAPRQARDKHSESTQNQSGVFLQATLDSQLSPGAAGRQHQRRRRQQPRQRNRSGEVREELF